MAVKTKNIGLEKPEYSGKADVGVINANMEIIDESFGNIKTMFEERTGYGALLQSHWRLGTLTSGAGAYSSSTTRIITPFLPVQNNLIVSTGEVKYAVYFYDEDKTYLSSKYIAFTNSETNFSSINIEGAKFYRLVAAYTDDAIIEIVEDVARYIKISIPTNEYIQSMLGLTNSGNEILFTDLEQQIGWWNATGGWIDEEHYHSQLIPVVPNKMYYVGFKIEASTLPCFGAYFDKNGNWRGPIMPGDVTQYEYKTADGTGTRTDYADLYCFVAPSDAHYVSINMSLGTERAYRNFVSSKPILAFSGTGNYEYSETSPFYQAKKNKSMCVFGASGVAIDRLKYPGSKYTIGFQEYLVPWYKKVESYGYWGWGWRANTTTPESSIYYQIVGRQMPLSEYNEFLLIPSTSNVDVETVGSVDSADVNTYAGAINAVIDYIYASVPDAKIYLANAVHKKNYATDETVKNTIDAVNALLKEVSEAKSLELIDLMSGSGISQYTQDEYTSDGTHLNSKGNQVQGLYIRKQLIGF